MHAKIFAKDDSVFSDLDREYDTDQVVKKEMDTLVLRVSYENCTELYTDDVESYGIGRTHPFWIKLVQKKPLTETENKIKQLLYDQYKMYIIRDYSCLYRAICCLYACC